MARRRKTTKAEKAIKIISWAVYLAPVAIAVYRVVKDYELVEKARPYVEPYVDSAKEAAQEVYETAKEKVNEVYAEVKNSDSPVETLKDEVKDAVKAVKKSADDISDGNA